MNFPESAFCSTGSTENSRSEYLVYLLLLTAHVLLLWLLPFFPTQDGPSHLYNLLILQDLLNGGKNWGDYYTLNLHAVPNLGFTLIGYPLLKIFPILTVERIFLTFYVLILGISVPALLKSFGKPPLPLCFLVFPVLFNFTLMMGFYSYNIAAALFLAALCVAWRMRDESLTAKAVFYNSAGAIIYFCHLIPFILYLISLFAMPVTERGSFRKKCSGILKQSLILIPSLVLLAWYFAQGNGGTATSFSLEFSSSRIGDLFSNLMLFSSAPFSRWQLIPSSILMFIVLLLWYLTLKEIRSKRKNGAISHAEKTLSLIVGALVLIYFIAPFRLGDGSYFNERFPWVIFLMGLPLLSIPGNISKIFSSTFLAGVATLFLLFNTAILWGESNKVATLLKGMDGRLSRRDLVMLYKPFDSSCWPKVDALFHAAAYFGILRGCVDIGNYETAVPFFPVRFNDNLPPLPSQDRISYEPEKIDFTEYPSIDYVIGWQVDMNARRRLAGQFDMIRSHDAMTLWRRKSGNPYPYSQRLHPGLSRFRHV